MKLYLKPLFFVLPILAVFTFGVYLFKSPDQAKTPPTIQQIAAMETSGLPNFNAITWDSRKFELVDHSGKIVIVNFWASWCAPCIEEIPSLIKLVEKFDGKIRLVAVSGDSEKKDVEIFLKSFPALASPNIDLIWDSDHRIMSTFKVEKLPESFVARPNLKLTKKIVGTVNWYTPDSIEFINGLLEKVAK